MKTIKKLALPVLAYFAMTTNAFAASGAGILSESRTLLLIVFFLLALLGLPRK